MANLQFDPNLKLYYRIGNFGQLEYRVPPNREREFITSGGAATTWDGIRTFISAQNFDDPSISRHEAIHIAQNRQSKQPNVDDILKALGYTDPKNPPIGIDTRNPKAEIPAYEFMYGMYKNTPDYIKALSTGKSAMDDLDQRTQGRYNNYLALLRKNDPKNAYNMEVAVDPQMALNNIRNVPAPPAQPPTPNMQQPFSLMDMLRAAFNK